MKGSDKQVKWATEIINNAIQAWDDLKKEVKPEAHEKFDAMKKDFFEKMNSQDAEVVITNRMNYPENAKHLKSNMGFFAKVKLV